MKQFILYFLLFTIFFSCTNEEKIPDYVISEDKMVEVLVDMELKQAEIKYKIAQGDSTVKNYTPEFEKTLKNHNLTFKQFNKNLDYYCSKPLIMQELYIQVIELLSEKQSSEL